MNRLICFLISIILVVPSEGQTWKTGAPIPIPVRAGNAASYVKGDSAYLFIVSGRGLNDAMTSAVQRYSVVSNSWDTVAVHPTGLLGGATAVLKDSLYLIGGVINPPGSGEQTVWKYSINENSWKTVKNFPFPHGDAKAVGYQDSIIYAAGGFNVITSAIVYMYNAHTDTWKQATSIPSPTGLNFGGFAITGDTLVYIGGTNSFGSRTYYNDVYVGVINQSDRSSIAWKKGASFPGATRTFFDANTWKNGIIMTGGSTNNTFNTRSNENYFYDAGKNSWTKLPDKPTEWLTGQSGSVRLASGEWIHVCPSGYGAAGYLSQTEIFSNTPTSVKKNDRRSPTMTTFDIYPNPFNPATTVRLSLNERSLVSVNVTDLLGRIVRRLTAGEYAEGEFSVLWNGKDDAQRPVVSGMYLITMTAAGRNGVSTETKKVMLVK